MTKAGGNAQTILVHTFGPPRGSQHFPFAQLGDSIIIAARNEPRHTAAGQVLDDGPTLELEPSLRPRSNTSRSTSRSSKRRSRRRGRRCPKPRRNPSAAAACLRPSRAISSSPRKNPSPSSASAGARPAPRTSPGRRWRPRPNIGVAVAEPLATSAQRPSTSSRAADRSGRAPKQNPHPAAPTPRYRE